MTRDDLDRFDALAGALNAARHALSHLIGWASQPGRPPDGLDPSIEAAAKKRIAELPTVEEAARVVALFEDYTEAVNALWLLAEQSGLTEQLVREYVKAHRRVVRESGADRQDLSAEATLAMRAQCIAWACSPDRRRPLGIYARPGIQRVLSAYVGREASAVTGYGDKTAQRRDKRNNRVDIDEQESQAEKAAAAQEGTYYEYDHPGSGRRRR